MRKIYKELVPENFQMLNHCIVFHLKLIFNFITNTKEHSLVFKYSSKAFSKPNNFKHSIRLFFKFSLKPSTKESISQFQKKSVEI